jgi:hypothetical protein
MIFTVARQDRAGWQKAEGRRQKAKGIKAKGIKATRQQGNEQIQNTAKSQRLKA